MKTNLENLDWRYKIENYFFRYQKITNEIRNIKVFYSDSEPTLSIQINLLDFPHALGLKKLAYFKDWSANKINIWIQSGKFIKKMKEKSNSKVTNSIINQIEAKIFVWEKYLLFLEGVKLKTLVLSNVNLSQHLNFFRGLMWYDDKRYAIVGLNKNSKSDLYKHDYCHFYTAISYTNTKISKLLILGKSIKKVDFIKKIWLNKIETNRLYNTN